MAGDNRLTTENFLRLNFTPKSGITPGTNDLLNMDCDQILTRYNVSITGISSTGLRLPSQNQINGIVTDPTSFTLVNEQTMGIGVVISTLEISFNGQYLYLWYPVLNKIRRYTLTTNFDVSTISTYQEIDTAYIPTETTGKRGFWLSPDQKRLFFINGGNVGCMIMSTANDLSTITSTVYYSVSDSDNTPSAVAFNPSGTVMLIYGEQNGIIWSYNLSTPFVITSGVTFKGYSNNNPPYISLKGLEFNSTGSFYFVMNEYVGSFHIYKYSCSTPYFPESKPNTISTDWDITSDFTPSTGNEFDMCFSDNITYMYILYSTSGFNNPVILQFSIS